MRELIGLCPPAAGQRRSLRRPPARRIQRDMTLEACGRRRPEIRAVSFHSVSIWWPRPRAASARPVRRRRRRRVPFSSVSRWPIMRTIVDWSNRSRRKAEAGETLGLPMCARCHGDATVDVHRRHVGPASSSRPSALSTRTACERFNRGPFGWSLDEFSGSSWWAASSDSRLTRCSASRIVGCPSRPHQRTLMRQPMMVPAPACAVRDAG